MLQLYLFSLFIWPLESRYVCFNNNIEGTILYDEEAKRFILPSFFNLYMLDEIYTDTYTLVTQISKTKEFERDYKCENLMTVNGDVFDGKIRIYTFEIRPPNSDVPLARFRLQLKKSLSAQRVELLSDEGNTKMYINVIQTGHKFDPDKGEDSAKNNYVMKLYQDDVRECFFLKAINFDALLRVPSIASWTTVGFHRLNKFIITFGNQRIEYYARVAFCPRNPIGFNFVFKAKPRMIDIVIQGIDRDGKTLFTIDFNYNNGQMSSKITPAHNSLEFLPNIYNPVEGK